MNIILSKIKLLREALALSQEALSQESGLSLSTIQNIESEKANPSLATLTAILNCLSSSIQIKPEAPDWQVLTACGLPLISCAKASIKPSRQNLKRELRRVIHQDLSERESEAVSALLWAIKDHYPTIFATDYAGAAFFSFAHPQCKGRLIKLRRNALAVLGKYL